MEKWNTKNWRWSGGDLNEKRLRENEEQTVEQENKEVRKGSDGRNKATVFTSRLFPL
jgi:hypothetical protein